MTFEELTYEYDVRKCQEYQGSEYSNLDDAYKDLRIPDVDNDELLKQYVVFSELTKLPPTFGDPLFLSSKKRRLYNGLVEIVDVDDAIESIQKNYKLADWQIDTIVTENSIRVILYIPDRADNVKLVVSDMVNMGYCVCDSFRQTKNGKTYMTLRFDPRFPKVVETILKSKT